MSKRVSLRVFMLSGAAWLYAVSLAAIPGAIVVTSTAARADGGAGGGSGTVAGGAGGAGSNGTAGANGGKSGSNASGGGGGSAGGGAGGTGGAGSGTGGTAGTGGTSGTPNGGAGGNGTSGGAGGGGGGGFNGNGAGATTVTNTSGTITGGSGGNGGDGTNGSLSAGGGGGSGGFGVIITSSTGSSNGGTIIGGNGGAGGTGFGANVFGGNGGDGGIGVFSIAGGTFTNTGTVSGGNGGVAGAAMNGASNGLNGAGGVGIAGFGLTIIDSGTISGGLSGNGTTRADAVIFTGGVNNLTLESGFVINGNVVAASAADTLALGGSTNASFDVSKIGSTAQFQGFGIYQKTGTSTWTLTGTTTAVTPWKISTGTLSISSDANLGASSGTITLDGGTLQFTSNVTSARAITINSTNGTIDNGGTTSTLSGIISGGGSLTSVGGGALVLTGVNTYTGGTIISAGTLQIGDGITTTSSIKGNISNNSALVFDVNGAISETGVISGSGSLTQNGTGVLTLGNANTYTGGTTVTGGRINFGSVGAFGGAAAPNVTLNGGGLQWKTGTTTDISSDLNPIGVNGGVFDTNGNNVSFGTALTGAGGITKTGAGTLTLTQANTFSGTTTITGGLINFSSLSNFGSHAAPNVTLNGGGVQWSASNTLDISGNLTDVGAGGGTFDTNGNNVTFNTALTGASAGGVTKAGAGTLTLITSNTYAGGTTISGGTLQLGNGTTAGTIQGNVVNNAALVFDEPGAAAFSGNITGSGTLTNLGTGSLTLSGNNNLTGAVSSNTALIFSATGATRMTGVISGSASLTQQGNGVLTLGGANTYTGGTTVTSGLINFRSLGSFGSMAAPNVTLNGGGLQWAAGTSTDISGDLNAIGAGGATFDTNGNNVTFATALTGAGGVTKAGAGVLTLTQHNTYAAQTTINGGLINFNSLQNFGTTPPPIVLNGGGLQWAMGNVLDISPDLAPIGVNGAIFDTNSNTITLATGLTGSGGILKIGVGTLILSPAEGYSGATIVGGGTLQVDSLLTSSSIVGVLAGGTVSGVGTLPSLVALGTVSPGDGVATGILHVSGNASLFGTTNINVTNATSSEIVISGAAGLAGTLQLHPSGGGFAVGDQFIVVTAAGGLSNVYSSVTTALGTSFGVEAHGAGLVPVASYTHNDVIVTLDAATISPFLPAGAGFNPRSVAAAIDFAMINDGAVPTFSSLATLSPSGLITALSGLSGELAPASQTVALGTADEFLDTLQEVTEIGTAAPRSHVVTRDDYVRVASNGPVRIRPRSEIQGLDLWAEIRGAYDHQDASAVLGTHATQANDIGAVFGIGLRSVTGRGTIGIAGGYDDVNWTIANGQGKGRASAYQGGVYGSILFGQTYVSAVGNFASFDVSTKRTVNFQGVNQYNAKFRAEDVGGRLEVGERYDLGAGFLSPYLAGAVHQLDTPAYSENTVSGSSAFALTFTRQSHTDVTGEIGAGYDSGAGGSERDQFRWHARLGWLHDFSARVKDDAVFQGFSGAVFTVDGAPPSKNNAHAVLGVEQDLGGLALSLDADGLVGTSGRRVGGNAGIAYRW